jgi:hypothetical protein
MGRHRRPQESQWLVARDQLLGTLRVAGQLTYVLTFLDNHDALTWTARAIAEISEAMGRLGS